MSAAEISLLTDADADADAIAAIAGLLRQVSSSAAPLTDERARQVLGTPSTSVLVARVDGRIVGMALLLTLTTFAGGSGYVEEVVVDGSARGQHVGAALMSALLDLAAEKGIRFVDLTSRPARGAANALYRSLGFELRPTNSYRYDLRARAAR
jgi:ribosomal protein S18 acetylase RimI-like enzyme